MSETEATYRPACGNTAPHEAHDTGWYTPGKPRHHGYPSVRCEGVKSTTYRCTAHGQCNGGLVGCCINGQWMIPGCDA